MEFHWREPDSRWGHVAAIGDTAARGNAERGQMVMVGDVVRQVSVAQGTPLTQVIDLQSLVTAIEDGKGPCTFVLERALHAPTTQRIILSHPLRSNNPGRSAAATWHHPSSWPRYSASSAMSARTLFTRGGVGRVGLVSFSELRPHGERRRERREWGGRQGRGEGRVEEGDREGSELRKGEEGKGGSALSQVQGDGSDGGGGGGEMRGEVRMKEGKQVGQSVGVGAAERREGEQGDGTAVDVTEPIVIQNTKEAETGLAREVEGRGEDGEKVEDRGEVEVGGKAEDRGKVEGVGVAEEGGKKDMLLKGEDERSADGDGGMGHGGGEKMVDAGMGDGVGEKGGEAQKPGGWGVRAIVGGTLWGRKRKSGKEKGEGGRGGKERVEQAQAEPEWVLFPFFEGKLVSGSDSGPDSGADENSGVQDATGSGPGLESRVAVAQASETQGTLPAEADEIDGREGGLAEERASNREASTRNEGGGGESGAGEARACEAGACEAGAGVAGAGVAGAGVAGAGVAPAMGTAAQEASQEKIEQGDTTLERIEGKEERRGEVEEEDGAEWAQAAEAAAALAAAMGGGRGEEGRESNEEEGMGERGDRGERERGEEGVGEREEWFGEGRQQGRKDADWQWPERGFWDASSGKDGGVEGGGKGWGLGVGRVDEFVEAYTRGVGDSRFEPLHSPTHTQVSEHLAFGAALLCPEDITSAHQRLGTTAVLDLQRATEKLNWAVDVDGMNRAARDVGVMVVHHPIRHHDGHDLRRKLPVAVGILHRLLRRGLHVLVTDTDGVDRAPAVVCAYLHWVLAIPLPQALHFVCDVRPCQPNRAALAAGTWDLVAILRHGVRHTGPATHSVQIAWNHGGREVLLVGELSGGWKNPVAATPVGGSKFVLALRLPLGSYRYKFIVDGHWRHAADLPTEVDEWGNTNNVLHMGSLARHTNDAVRERVIERPLTDLERRMVTFASQRVAFSVSPITFTPKLRPARS
ncbi:unnamed protein product [Closterium sp. Naga37s-1]|nr:unnamed protein product [Closterium sp. Naga37s-1]